MLQVNWDRLFSLHHRNHLCKLFAMWQAKYFVTCKMEPSFLHSLIHSFVHPFIISIFVHFWHSFFFFLRKKKDLCQKGRYYQCLFDTVMPLFPLITSTENQAPTPVQWTRMQCSCFLVK